MDILGWIVAGLVILGMAVAALIAISYRIRGRILKVPRTVDASIKFVQEIQTPDKSWPEYMLTLRYEAEGKRFRRRVTLLQVDFERLFPGVAVGEELDGSSTVPLLLDFHRPENALLDPRWLGTSR